MSKFERLALLMLVAILNRCMWGSSSGKPGESETRLIDEVMEEIERK